MLLEQYYTECLSHASYLVGDETTGRAIVVDPRRDIGDYLRDAEAYGMTIEGVINTHFHADFVAGHLEFAHATGAWIGMGAGAHADYPIRWLANRDHISLGAVDLEILFRVAKKLPRGVLAVAESGIQSGRDISRLRAAGYGAFLIGETVMRAERPGETLKQLLVASGLLTTNHQRPATVL